MAKFIVSPAGAGNYKILFPKPMPIDMAEYVNLTNKYKFSMIVDKSNKPWKLSGVICPPEVFERFLKDKGYDELTIRDFNKSL